MNSVGLYNKACTARITGALDPRLQDFYVKYNPPVTASFTPAMPTQKQIDEYTIWLTVMGVERQWAIIKARDQPVTLSAANRLYADVIRDAIVYTSETQLITLDKLQNFFALMLRYPMLPRLAADTNHCPECYYEASVSFDTWEDTREKMACFHFTLRHEFFPSTNNASLCDEKHGEHDEMVRFDTSESVVPCFAETRPKPGALGFLTQLEDLKRRDEITKQKTLGKDVVHKLQTYAYALAELEVPRYVSPYPIMCLLRLYGSLNRSRARVAALDRRGDLGCDDDTIRRACRDLRAQFAAVASTCTTNNVLSLVCMAMIGPLRRYDARYGVVAERVVLFKHLISCGFSVDVASKMLHSIQTCKCTELLECDLESGVDRQLKKTNTPTIYNIKVARLLWLAAHVSAYCTLRQLARDYVRMGDDPCDLTSDGIYIFDNDHIGFRLSRRDDYGTERVHTMYVGFAYVVDMFAMRDYVEKTLSRTDLSP